MFLCKYYGELETFEEIFSRYYLPKSEINKYSIYFYYNKSESIANYTIVKKDNPACHLTIFIDKKFVASTTSSSNLSKTTQNLLKELIVAYENYLFVHNKDKLRELFIDVDPKTLSLLDLGIGELLSVIEVRNEFVSIQNKFLIEKNESLNLNESYSSKKADFELSIDSFTKERSSISLTFGRDKKYKIKDINSFLDSYDDRETKTFGKFLKIKLGPDSVTERANNLINILKRRADRYGYFLFDEATIFDIISLFQGEIITFEGFPYNVSSEEIESSVYYKEDGSLGYSPDLGFSNGTKIQNKNKLLFVDETTHVINTYVFTNKANLDLYLLSKSLGGSFNKVEDLFSDEFKDFLEKAIRPKVLNAEDSKLSIQLYISLDLQKYVNFKTKYIYEENEIDPLSLDSNPFYKSIIIDYRLSLEELGFLENGKSKELETLNTVIISDYSRIKNYAKVFLSDDILQLKKSKLQSFKVSISKENNWISVQIKSDDYSKEDIQKILNAYKKKKKYILLKNDFIDLSLSNDQLQALTEINDTFNLDDDLSNKKVPLYQAFKIPGFDKIEKDESLIIDYDEQIKAILKEIKDFKNANVPLNEALLKSLRPYQVDGVKWMYTLYKNSLSGILADDMGLGKTLQFLAFQSLVTEDAPTLIICPKSLIYNWEAEVFKWNPDKNVYTISGSKSERLSIVAKMKHSSGIFVVSYDSMRNDLDLYEKIHFAIVCLDEAQYIKNSYAKKTKAVKSLDATCRFALTGTPIENGLTDLWSIFDFLMPNYLLSEDKFIQEYNAAFDKDTGNEETRNKLLAKITPFILRRTKDEVLTDLPPKTEEVIKISMNEKQSELYNVYAQNTLNSFHEDPKNKLKVLAAMTRLRQICVDPSTFLENYRELPSKLEYTISLVKESIAASHKILIFSQFTSVLEHLINLLKKENVTPFYICGDTPGDQRVKIADEFNTKDDCKVICVSLKAGGTGLNLFGADTVIILDPWWNYAVEDQATGRAHRIGQTRPVTVYKLIAHDSIEEKVVNLQNTKKDLFDNVVKTGSENISNFSDEDIAYLLS